MISSGVNGLFFRVLAGQIDVVRWHLKFNSAHPHKLKLELQWKAGVIQIFRLAIRRTSDAFSKQDCASASSTA
jgi:hypothetical protein